MNSHGARWRLAGALGMALGMALCLGACGGAEHRLSGSDDNDDGANTFPANYKADILAAMHAYFNDPTGIRDAGIAEPVAKPVGGRVRYVVCVRFNAKQNAATYAGARDFAAVFVAGHFDHFVEIPREQCAGATYAAFPELEKLPR